MVNELNAYKLRVGAKARSAIRYHRSKFRPKRSSVSPLEQRHGYETSDTQVPGGRLG